ncbi:MAG TPA: transporter [Steroidobacteraceae bacterium]|nr:transporter [Steroidobacteraceae bacterium]
MTQFTTRGLLLALAVLASAAAAADDAPRQALADAWWTGPLLAPNASTFPAGHALIETYVFDVNSNGQFDASRHHEPASGGHELGSLTYLIYGLTDRVSVGLLPRFFYEEPAGAPNSSSPAVGDLGAQVQVGLTSFHEGSLVPATALVLGETVPTGRYDALANPADGFGAGVYSTSFSWYSQDYLWLPNGRILRVRLDLTYAISSSASLRDQSVYGTPVGFRGYAYPGDSFTVDAAAEYSVTRKWVLATDVVWLHNASTRLSGSEPAAGGAAFVDTQSGSSEYLAVAPAVEYNFSSRVGVIFGARIFVAGRNAGSSVTTAAAINMAF